MLHIGPMTTSSVALLVEVEELPLIGFGVEQNSLAMAYAGRPGRKAGITHHGGMVVEPVDIARCHVETQEIVAKPLRLNRFEIVDSRLELGLRESPAAPAEAGEILRRSGRARVVM